MNLVESNKAVALLSNGELVIIPTDTVYGIACDYANEHAAKKVYEIKGRSEEKPLIVLIASVEMLKGLVEVITERHKLLMNIFWPGALTLIFRKSENISEVISAGGVTIGVRMPAHEKTLAIIKSLGRPIVATSVNKSGSASLMDLEKIVAEFSELAIVDGGKQLGWIESTVLDLSGDKPKILRQGTILEEDIENILGEEIF